MTTEFKDLLDLVDDLEIRHPHNWRGDVQVEGYEQPWLDYCYFLFYSLVLAAERRRRSVLCGSQRRRRGWQSYSE